MKRIVLVDDDPAIQDALQMIFSGTPYQFDVCSTGEQVLAMKGDLPDLFLIDKQLSGVDGLQVCRTLKSGEHSKHIPVIVLSATPNIEALAAEAGADDVLEKPFHIKVLTEKVEKALEGIALQPGGA